MCVCMNDLCHYFCFEMRDISSETEQLLDHWLQTSGCKSSQDLVGPQLSHKYMFMILTFVTPCIVTYFFIINQSDALISQIYFGRKLYIFRTVPLSIIRSFSLYTQQQICVIQVTVTAVSKTCMTYTIAVCTVKNS